MPRSVDVTICLETCTAGGVRTAVWQRGSRARKLWFGFLLFVLAIQASQAKLILIAHRGESSRTPENTLAAFSRARVVADFVEFDVRSTRDGQLVVIHDSTVDRTTNGTGNVSDLSLAQVQALDAGTWFDKAFVGEKIPTAADTLSLVQASAAPFLERKSGTVAQFVALLQQRPLRPEGIVMSFDYAFVVELKRALPVVNVGWIGSGTLSQAQIAQAIGDGITHFVWSNSDLSGPVVS
jgi:glycerophosphoryl diester phosphodiesterase